ncbi:endonuclease/exonuclease/phosphatase family protein [Parvularcula dongshanensis]|uniref:Endonuclease/exonuclease/phosphatase family metal-dependent hydrolase n=1 Tax=Parvularcula dongshanensis TaxID=1173995 RepID=A0A840I0L6_9PROT|nr:endonuclease/exonuclease/phosphatase family protein [Parvularcula dongshanensis]MBB4657650.1 endonuclease/exonuclease/phosphatase family metal-dependent hydrolase [Parvularcula dongshanensis]
MLLALLACAESETPPEAAVSAPERPDGVLRVATYNVSLYRDGPGELVEDLEGEDDPQLRAVSAVVATVSPDILVLNEVDWDEGGEAVRLLAERLGYPHRLSLRSNTGVPSGRDFDHDGRSDHEPGDRDYGGDAFGYGVHEGQYGMAVLSRLPIEENAVRTYRETVWADMPGNVLPTSWYDEGDREVFRLSSKTHALIPIKTSAGPLTLVLAHPTPPGFDGPEDRNGARNHDEVRMLLDLIDPARGGWLRDDEGRPGGLAPGAMFVVAGDLNADPSAPDPYGENGGIRALLASPLLQDPAPRSAGGAAAAARQGGANDGQSSDPALDTADFSDGEVGNLRADYVLPSATLDVQDAGVFWPAEGEEGYALVGPGYPVVSSDHRLVWADLRLPED